MFLLLNKNLKFILAISVLGSAVLFFLGSRIEQNQNHKESNLQNILESRNALVKALGSSSNSWIMAISVISVAVLFAALIINKNRVQVLYAIILFSCIGLVFDVSKIAHQTLEIHSYLLDLTLFVTGLHFLAILVASYMIRNSTRLAIKS
ncbi:MAG: hypothetical protein KBF89_00745 [Acidimicrobiia bacterium]|nr:hypothetical protein [Acidimicrobiia bacterium]